MRHESNWCGIPLLCLSIAFAGAPAVAADEPTSRDARDLIGAGPHGERRVVGLSDTNCFECHGRVKPASGQQSVSDIGQRSNDGWILHDEITRWRDHDHHYQAFSILLGDQSKLIAKQLGIVDQQGESQVHRDRRCLSCHSSIPVGQMKVQGDLVQEETHHDPRYTIGVSCEACHGPAGKSTGGGAEGWGSAHARPRDSEEPASWWRTLSPKQKFEDFGYWDVHSIRSQTRICLSCHVGNVEQQKVITHEMYAAGHPPLPSFELSQFVHQMPRHWRRLDEKNKRVRDAFVKDSNQYRLAETPAVVFDPEEAAVAKATMIAALVTLEESLQLTADLIDRQAANPDSAQWPELANYACYACHHELQRDGWRQTRRLTAASKRPIPATPGRRVTATPGRPMLHEWPFALSRVTAATLEKHGLETGFNTEIDGVVAALNSRPYGHSAELKKAAVALAKAAESQSRKLTSLSIHRDRAREMLANLAATAAAEPVDYDSARQLVWAFERTHAELAALNRPDHNPEQPDGPPVLTEWNTDDPALKGLDESLILWLARNPKSSVAVQVYVGELPIKGRTVFLIDISRSLQKASEYDPQSFREAFQKLQLPKP